MGDRAVVIFTNKSEMKISPAIYLHWNGGPESIYAYLTELDRRMVRADQNYEAARFVAIAAEHMDHETYRTTSLGIVNGPGEITIDSLSAFDPGDNGIYVVCREAGRVRVRRFVAGNCCDALAEMDEIDVTAERSEALARENGILDKFDQKRPIGR